jgi:hypothetical protein
MKKLLALTFAFLMAASFQGYSIIEMGSVEKCLSFDPDKIYRIELYNGRVYQGKIVEDDGVKVKIDSESVGIIIIQKSEIKSIKEIKKEDSDYVMNEPLLQSKVPQMNLLSQSAFTPQKGNLSLYISLLHMNAEFSITNTTVVGFETAFFAAYGFNVKQSYDFTESFRAAIKLKFGGVLGMSLTDFNAGAGQAAFTFGHDANNFTISGGLLMYTDFDIYTQPFIGGAFQTEITPTASLLGEAMYMPNNSAFIGMFGFRKETEAGMGIFNSYYNSRNDIDRGSVAKVYWDFGGGLFGFDSNYQNGFQPDLEIYPGIMIRYSRGWN